MQALPFLTPAKILLCASVETGLNALLTDDNRQQLRRLRGKALQVEVRELQLTLTFMFSQQIDVLGEYEGEADCRLSLSVSVLPQLQDQSQLTRLIKEDKLDLQGDIHIAQRFSELLQQMKPDWEECLSRYTGDIVAHTVVSGGQRQLDGVKRWLAERERDVAEVITEEWRIAPGPLEVAHFCDQVDDLRSDAERLLARVERRLNNEVSS
uniref:ubiquinone biosynthesis accessory factor UbiJ n=1 Tax=Thaumasiovibrio occultus TaxID=1891184 RepID=UPI000B3507FB|nr:SCP2 domain-containing protein [Thaumasiovibrio occultus]